MSREGDTAARTRLASRQSFFGGPVSTRHASKTPSWRDMPSITTLVGKTAEAAERPVRRPRGAFAAAMEAVVDKRKSQEAAPSLGDSKSAKNAAKLRKTSPAMQKREQRGQLLRKYAAAATGGVVQQAKQAQQDATTPDLKPSLAGGEQRTAPQMLRHQQMTSMGVQTVQLVTTSAKLLGRRGVPSAGHYPAEGSDENIEPALPSTRQLDATLALASPGRERASKAKAISRHSHAHSPEQPPATAAAKQKKKQRLQGTFYGSAQPPAAFQPIRTVDDDSASDLESFLASDDEENADGGDGGGCVISGQAGWEEELRSALNGYDASKYAAVDALPLGRMRASFEEIAAEEERAKRLGAATERQEEKRGAVELLEDSSDSDSESESEEEDGVAKKRRRQRGGRKFVL